MSEPVYYRPPKDPASDDTWKTTSQDLISFILSEHVSAPGAGVLVQFGVALAP